MINQKKRTYTAVDICKLIMAIIVVAIHTNPITATDSVFWNSFFRVLSNLAVPYFFLVSGFFLFKKTSSVLYGGKTFSNMKKHIGKMIKLYLILSAVYLPLAIVGTIQNGQSILNGILIYLRGFFIIGENYWSTHLWFILAEIYALAIIYFLLKRKLSVETITIIAIIFYLFGQLFHYVDFSSLSDIWQFVLGGVQIFARRMSRGFLYIALGLVFARALNKKRNLSQNKKREENNNIFCINIAIICVLLFVLSIFFEIDIVLTPIIAFGLFIVTIKIPSSNKINTTSIRSFSKTIYYSHMYFVFVCSYLAMGVTWNFAFSVLCSVVLSIATYLFLTIYKDRKKKKYKQTVSGIQGESVNMDKSQEALEIDKIKNEIAKLEVKIEKQKEQVADLSIKVNTAREKQAEKDRRQEEAKKQRKVAKLNLKLERLKENAKTASGTLQIEEINSRIAKLEIKLEDVKRGKNETIRLKEEAKLKILDEKARLKEEEKDKRQIEKMSAKIAQRTLQIQSLKTEEESKKTSRQIIKLQREIDDLTIDVEAIKKDLYGQTNVEAEQTANA